MARGAHGQDARACVPPRAILADGRCILIEERQTKDGGVIGLRVDITELKQREASFRLLFESNPVPMILCARDDARIIEVNAAAIAHYGYARSDFAALKLSDIQAFETKTPWSDEQSDDERAARMWKHIKADGSLIDMAIYTRDLVFEDKPAVLMSLIDITERRRAEARLAFMAQHDGLTGLPKSHPAASASRRCSRHRTARRRTRCRAVR